MEPRGPSQQELAKPKEREKTSSSSVSSSKENVRLVVSDNHLFSEKIIGKTDKVTLVDLKQITSTPIMPEDVVQSGIGNCYFLAAIVSLLQKDPALLDNVIKFNKGYFEVTFHSARDPNRSYTYVLDPTKIIGKDHNNHTHDLIFMLEKAYAYHRIKTEPLTYTGFDAQIHEALVECNLDKKKTLAVLVDKELAHIKKEEDRLKDLIATIYQRGLATTTNLTNEEKKITDFLLNGFTEQQTFSEMKKEINFRTEEYIKFRIPKVLNQMTDERIDYISALNAGYSKDAFMALTGQPATVDYLPEEENLRYFLNIFLTNVSLLPPSEYDQQTKTTFNKIFDSTESETGKFFIELIKKTNLNHIQEMVVNYDKAEQPKPLLEDVIRDLFDINSKIIKWPKLGENDTRDMETSLRILNYLAFHIPKRRGDKNYIDSQLSFYEQIKSNLQNGKLVNVSTKPEVARMKESVVNVRRHKGLIGLHAYTVVNCYERDGRKYLLLRNPWGNTVRGYHPKSKVIHGHENEVLAAIEKKQLSDTNFFSKFTFGKKEEKPSVVSNPALPFDAEKFGKYGYFELELSDFTKRFSKLTIADTPAPDHSSKSSQP